MSSLSSNPEASIRREAARSYALLAAKWESQHALLEASAIEALAKLLKDPDHSVVRVSRSDRELNSKHRNDDNAHALPMQVRYALLALGNLAVRSANHDAIFDSGALFSILPLAASEDVEVHIF